MKKQKTVRADIALKQAVKRWKEAGDAYAIALDSIGFFLERLNDQRADAFYDDLAEGLDEFETHDDKGAEVRRDLRKFAETLKNRRVPIRKGKR